MAYLSGLSGETPLGNIVRIRTEKDPKRIKEFTSSEHEIRNKWRNKSANQVNVEDYSQAMASFKNMFIAMANEGGGKK